MGQVAKIQRRKWNKLPAKQAWNSLAKDMSDKQPKVCKRCGTKGSKDNPIQKDHIIPKSRGGRDALFSLRYLCKACNMGRKRDKSYISVGGGVSKKTYAAKFKGKR